MKPFEEYSLRNCPFCMSNDLDIKRRLYGGEKLFRIKCDKCGSLSGEYENIQAAIIAWNNRPVDVASND